MTRDKRALAIPCDAVSLHEYQPPVFVGDYAGDPAVRIRTTNFEAVTFPPVTKDCRVQAVLWWRGIAMARTNALNLRPGDSYRVTLPVMATIDY